MGVENFWKVRSGLALYNIWGSGKHWGIMVSVIQYLWAGQIGEEFIAYI